MPRAAPRTGLVPPHNRSCHTFASLSVVREKIVRCARQHISSRTPSVFSALVLSAHNRVTFCDAQSSSDARQQYTWAERPVNRRRFIGSFFDYRIMSFNGVGMRGSSSSATGGGGRGEVQRKVAMPISSAAWDLRVKQCEVAKADLNEVYTFNISAGT